MAILLCAMAGSKYLQSVANQSVLDMLLMI